MPMETAFRSDERFTQAEFFEWLQKRPRGDINHYQLLDGHVVMTPPAASGHGSIETRIVTELQLHVRNAKGGRVYASSTGYDLPSGDTVEPDASFVSAERLSRAPKPDPATFLKIGPDLVVEILSPSTSRRDRTDKKRIYAKNGVTEYWIVDPKRRRVTIFSLEDASYGPAVEVASGNVSSAVLPGFSVPLETIFEDWD